jgi:hypothetical protein
MAAQSSQQQPGLLGRIIGSLKSAVSSIGQAEVAKAKAKVASTKAGEVKGLARVANQAATGVAKSALNVVLDAFRGPSYKENQAYAKFNLLIKDKSLTLQDEDRVIELLRKKAKELNVPFQEQFLREQFRLARGISSLRPQIEATQRWYSETEKFIKTIVSTSKPEEIPTWEEFVRTLAESAKKKGIKAPDFSRLKKVYTSMVAQKRGLPLSMLTQSAGSSMFYSPYATGKTTEEIERANAPIVGPISQGLGAILFASNLIEAGIWASGAVIRHYLTTEADRARLRKEAAIVDELSRIQRRLLGWNLVGKAVSAVIDVPLSVISGSLKFMATPPKESFWREVYRVGSEGATSVLAQYDVPASLKAVSFVGDIIVPAVPLSKTSLIVRVPAALAGRAAVKGVKTVGRLAGVDDLTAVIANKIQEGEGPISKTIRWSLAGMGVGTAGRAKRTAQDIIYEARKNVRAHQNTIADNTKKVKVAIDNAAQRKVTGISLFDEIAAKMRQIKEARAARRAASEAARVRRQAVWETMQRVIPKQVRLWKLTMGIPDVTPFLESSIETLEAFGEAAREIFTRVPQEVTGPLWYSKAFREERARISRGVSEAIDESLEETLKKQASNYHDPAARMGVPLDRGSVIRRVPATAEQGPFETVSKFTRKQAQVFSKETGLENVLTTHRNISRRTTPNMLFSGAKAAQEKYGTTLSAEFGTRILQYSSEASKEANYQRWVTFTEALQNAARQSGKARATLAEVALQNIDEIMLDIVRNGNAPPSGLDEMFGIWSALRQKASRYPQAMKFYKQGRGATIVDELVEALKDYADRNDIAKRIGAMFVKESDGRYVFPHFTVGGVQPHFTKEEVEKLVADVASIFMDAKTPAEVNKAIGVARRYIHNVIGTRFVDEVTAVMRGEQRANAIEKIGEKLAAMDVHPEDIQRIQKAVREALEHEEQMGLELHRLGIIKNLVNVLGAHVRLRYGFYQNPTEFIANMDALARALNKEPVKAGLRRVQQLKSEIEMAARRGEDITALQSEMEAIKQGLKTMVDNNPYIVPLIEDGVPPHVLEEAAKVAESTKEFYIPGSTAPSVVKKSLGYARKKLTREQAIKLGREMGIELRVARGLEQAESIEMRKGFDKLHDTLANAGLVRDTYKPGFSFIVDAPEVYGKLAGKWVSDGAYWALQDIVNEMKAGVLRRMRKEAGPGKPEDALEALYTYFKLSKTAFDPRTQSVNIISNVMALNYQAHGLHPSDVGWYTLALLELARGKGRYLNMYRKYYPAGLSGFMTAELGMDLLRAENLNWTGLKGAVREFLMRNAVNNAVKAWEFSEEWAKLAGFIYLVNKGVPEAEAALRATNAIFDYARTPALLKTITRSPWGVPFVSFPYHYTRRLAEALWSHPERIRNVVFIMTNAPKVWMDQETLQLVENTMSAQPSYVSEQKIPVSFRWKRDVGGETAPTVKTYPKYPFMPLFGMVGERYGLPMPLIGGTPLEPYEPILRSVSPWFLQIFNVVSGKRATGAVAARPELMTTIGQTAPGEEPTLVEESKKYLINFLREMGPLPTGIVSGTMWWPLRSAVNLGRPFRTEWGQEVGLFDALAAWIGIRAMDVGTKEFQRYAATFREQMRALSSSVASLKTKVAMGYNDYRVALQERGSADIVKYLSPSWFQTAYNLALRAYTLEAKAQIADKFLTEFLVYKRPVKVIPIDKIRLTEEEQAEAIKKADAEFLRFVYSLGLTQTELLSLLRKLKGKPREIISSIPGVDEGGSQ